MVEVYDGVVYDEANDEVEVDDEDGETTSTEGTLWSSV